MYTQLLESRKVPVKFYQNKDGSIYYESAFTQGEAPDLNAAFKEFSRDDFVRDFYYYYDDVEDARVGQFIPATEDRISKGKRYLGMLEIEVDTSDIFKDSPHSLTYLQHHKKEIPLHLKRIKDMKAVEQQRKVVNELFSPQKSIGDLICDHCGEIIPAGTYYETYKTKFYHIECAWHKLVGHHEPVDLETSKEYFHSLKRFIGDWPAVGYDTEDYFLTDLEFVKHNARICRM